MKLAWLVTRRRSSPIVAASITVSDATEKPRRERAKMPANEKNDHDHRPSVRPKIYEFSGHVVVSPANLVRISRVILYVCAFVHCTPQSSFSMKICEGNKISAILRNAMHLRASIFHTEDKSSRRDICISSVRQEKESDVRGDF